MTGLKLGDCAGVIVPDNVLLGRQRHPEAALESFAKVV